MKLIQSVLLIVSFANPACVLANLPPEGGLREVLEIYYRTWAWGIFEFTPQDSAACTK